MIKKKIMILLASVTILVSGCSLKNNDVTDAAREASSLASDIFERLSDIADENDWESTASGEKENEKAENESSKDASTYETLKKSSTDSSSDKTDLAKKDDAAQSVTTENANSSESSSGQKNQDDQASQTNSSDQTAQPEPEPQPEPAPQPQKVDYGRILFAGDSRTVDMFDGGTDEIRKAVYDGITVYCKDACQLDYMEGAVSDFGMDNFDTLVSWMGCNDYGNFAKYIPFYENILASGKKLVLCTVGPTDDNSLDEEDKPNYYNQREIEYNAALASWANGKGIKVIDVYSYINSNSDIYLDPVDGIHYQPQPTTAIWRYILSSL